jgi:HK97 family phage portal protein
MRLPWSKRKTVPADAPALEQKAVVIHELREPSFGGAPLELKGIDINERTTHENSAVAAIIRFAQRATMSGRVRWVQVDPSDAPAEKGEMLQLLNKPNVETGGAQFRTGLVLSLMLTGDAFVLPVMGLRGVAELWYLPPWSVSVVADPSTGRLKEYKHWSAGGVKTYLPDELIHIRDGVDPSNELRGWSGIRSVLAEIMTDEEATRYTFWILKNLGLAGLILSLKDPTKTELDEDTADEITARVRAATTGSSRGGVVVLTAAMEAMTPGIKPDQMALSSIRTDIERRICAATGIPSVVAGLGEDPKYDNWDAAVLAAYDQVMIPLWELIAEELTIGLDKYLPEGHRLILNSDRVEALAKRKEEQKLKAWTRAVAAFEKGLIDRADARFQMDLEVRKEDKGLYYGDTPAAKKGAMDKLRERGAANSREGMNGQA